MRKLYTYPWLIVAVIVVITVFFAFQLPRLELDNNNFRFVPGDDPALATSRQIDEMFGSSLFILVGLQRQYGTVFDREFLNRIRDYTQMIHEIPIVRETTSLVNADYITSIGDAIVVEKLVGNHFSGTPEEIVELKRRLLSWDMYERALFSDDYSATQILIPLTISSEDASLPETTEHIVMIRDLAYQMFADTASVYVTGMPIIMSTVNEAMKADLKLLVPVVILVMLLALFLSFRSFTPVFLPLVTVIISAVWTMGAMPLFGIKLSVISTVLPVILVAVGSGESIHLLIHYLHGIKNRPGINRDEHTELVLATLMKMRRSIFLTALTTFAGFSSLCFTPVIPCREFGFFSSFGVAVAFIITIFLVPALLIIKGPGKPQKVKTREGDNAKEEKVNAFIADNLVAIARKKKTILFVAAIVIVFSVYGLSKLIIDNAMVEYFREDTTIYLSDDFIRRQFGGSKVVSIVVESDSSETTLHPDTLIAMDGLSTYLQQKVPNAGKVLGFTDLVKRVNQVFNAEENPGNREQGTGNNEQGTFGFGDFGFGFEDFGFDDFSDSEAVALSDTEVESSNVDKVYTQNELLALFDNAGTSFRGMNANDFVQELKRQVNYEGAAYYEIPSEPKRYGKETPEELQRIIANYLVLLSGNINEYANDPLEPTAIKTTVQLRTIGMEDSHVVFREIDQYIAANFPDNVNVTIGGATMVEDSINNRIVQNQITSILFSIISILIIIAIANKSLAAGLLAMTPLSISILLNFAIMGFTGIKLNLGTSMVGAVAVCVGIDYTIHCLEAYRREYAASGGGRDFLRRAFFVSGKAIIVNAVSVGASFAVMMLSSFVMLADFGALIAFTMFSSALVSLTVLPALLAVFKPKFITGAQLKHD